MTRPALPNSPLGEVVFEIRFPGDLSLPARWGGLQADLAVDFPKLFVPHAAHGEALALKPYRLASADDSEMVTLSLSAFSFISKRYKTFGEFHDRFRDIFAIATRYVTPRHVTRTGLRYVNWIPKAFGSGEPSFGQLHPALKLVLAGAPAGEPRGEPQVVFQIAARDQTLRVALVPDPGGQSLPEEYQTSMLLDLDCFCAGEIPLDQIDRLLVEAHSVIDDAFFGLVTDEYLNYLKGEGV